MHEAFLFPLSFAQQRLWFLDQMSPRNSFYNLSTGIRLNFPVQIEVANRCFNELIRRHEILRTKFVMVEDKPYQLVMPELQLKLPLVDIPASSVKEQSDAVQVIINNEVRNGFDLANGPLLRGKILRLAERENIFMVSMHHIISDGWSIGIFFKEFQMLYEAYIKGRRSPLQELPIQYADYSVWQRDLLTGATLDRYLTYWKENLKGWEELQLETDFPRPPVQTYRGNFQQKIYSNTLLDALRQLSRKEGVTLFMLLLAAFFILLHHYSRQTDIVIGTPLAGRNRAEVEGLIGFFINNLVFRADLSGNPPFRDLLAQVKKMALNAYAHQDLPFEKLVEELNLERDLSKNPIFQVTFQLINTPTLSNNLTGSNLNGKHNGNESGKTQDIQKGTAMFDMAFDLMELPEGLMVQLEYSTDLFQSDTIKKFIDNYQFLLEAIVRNPSAGISSLPYYDRSSLNMPAAAPISEANSENLCTKGIHQYFEKQVSATPEQTAIITETGEEISFGMLNGMANQLANGLLARGLGLEPLIGICFSSSFDMILSMLAVLKAGGAYVPIDPTYPTQRLKLMTEQLSLVLSKTDLREQLQVLDKLIVQYIDEWNDLAEAGTNNPNAKVNGQNLAYTLFTSGSTGRPKGVMVPHGALVNHMDWMKEQYPLKQAERVLQRTSFSFDASVWEIYAPLLEGGTLVLVDQKLKNDSHYLAGRLEDIQVNVMQVVPSLLVYFHESGLLFNKPNLRRVFCGGEALPADLCADLLDQYPTVDFVNLYGPTEVTIDATYWPFQSLPAHFNHAPIGKAVKGISVYILDNYLNPVPEGVTGEIYLGGKGVGRGYFKNPGLTAQRFLPDPFSVEGAIMYRTGDLGKLLPNGDIYFKGRADEQVKIRGFRIELGEIESVLREHKTIENAVAITRKDRTSRPQLVAYYTLREDKTVDETAIWNYLEDKLPAYMVPASIVPLDSIPLAPNGKLDRKALPDPLETGTGREEGFQAPESDFEITMASIWSEVLDVPEIGLNYHFFRDLGGHSLLATQLVSKVRSNLQVEVSLQRIFECPTLKTFSDIVLEEAPNPEQILKTAAILVEINQMSEQEIDRLLSET